MKHLSSICRKAIRGASLGAKLLLRRSSIDGILSAHRFLIATGYYGQARGRDALKLFHESGYTCDDFLTGLLFMRHYGGRPEFDTLPSGSLEDNARWNLRLTAWNAGEEQAALGSIPEMPASLAGEGDLSLEDWTLGHITFVVSASAELSREIVGVFREADVGGAIIAMPRFPFAPEWTSLLRSLQSIRSSLREGGLRIPRVTIVAVGCDPIRACAAEWAGVQNGPADPEAFMTALADAAGGNATNPLASCCDLSRNEGTFFQAVAREVGLPVGETMEFRIEPEMGFAETSTEDLRYLATRYESIHLLALKLRKERLLPGRPAGFTPRPSAARTEFLSRVQCSGDLLNRLSASGDANEAWRNKWSSVPGRTSGEIVYVFPHIPKTAGSSVAHHFRQYLDGPGEYAHVRHITDEGGIRRDAHLPFEWSDARERSLARVIFGHGVKRRFCQMVPGKSAREIVTLREPAERMISHYNFWMHISRTRGLPVVSFDEWYANEPRNYQVSWIAENYLEIDARLHPPENLYAIVDSVLEEFWMVSTLETFSRDMALVTRELSLPDVSERKNVGGGDRFPKLISLTDELRARLRAENSAEYQLYEKWLARARERHS